ncbi:MAG: hypothetical protein INR73_02510 [Williamsia sp.]|nr:hypothetical protein [Williamsia sp.]
MSTLDARQLNELANSFLAFAQAVGDYRYENTLTPAENRELSDLQWTLLNYSDDLFTTSAVLVMNDVADSLATIDEITKDINKTYRKLRNIQKAINVAGAAVTLGAALFSKNPQAVGKAIGGLVKTWKEKEDEEEEEA